MWLAAMLLLIAFVLGLGSVRKSLPMETPVALLLSGLVLVALLSTDRL